MHTCHKANPIDKLNKAYTQKIEFAHSYHVEKIIATQCEVVPTISLLNYPLKSRLSNNKKHYAKNPTLIIR